MTPLAYVVTAALFGAPPPADAGATPAAEAPSDDAIGGEDDGAVAAGPEEDPGADRSARAPSEGPTSPELADPSTEPTSDPIERPSPALIQRRKADARRGRALTIAGATLTGLGLAGRIGIDVFLATVADLAPREPFGRWSIGPIFMATTFSNVPTLVGVGLLGGGSYHEARAHGRRFDHPASRRTKRTAWGLLGGGLGLWGLSRALFIPWTRACESNACAYGYLESTYFISAGLVISGVVLVAREAGFSRAQAEGKADYIKLQARRRAPTLTPVVAPGFQGLSLSGRF